MVCEELASNGDGRCTCSFCSCPYSNAVRSIFRDLVAGTGSRCCSRWIAWDRHHVCTRKRANVHHCRTSSSSALVPSTSTFEWAVRRVAVTDLVEVCRKHSTKVPWQRAVVIDGILVNSIDDRVHVSTALSVTCLSQLTRWVDSDDNDRSENRDNTDNEQKLDEGETALTTSRCHT